MEEVIGYIKSIIFENAANSYVVANLKIDQKKDETITIVGYFKPGKKEELYRFYGEYIDHPRYGRQFKVEKYERIDNKDPLGIIRYLSSSAFPHVGSKAAQKVVDALGVNCLTLIKEDPSVLANVDLKQAQRISIINGIKANDTHLEEAMALFLGHGIDMKTLLKMDAIYQEKLVSIVTANPYQLIKDVDGINFKTAERIAQYLTNNKGAEFDDNYRLEALLVYAVMQICYRQQDTYTNRHELYIECQKYCNEQLSFDDFESILTNLIEKQEIIQESDNLFPLDLYQAEMGIANRVAHYIKTSHYQVPFSVIATEIKNIESQEGITYSPDQRQAITDCINNDLFIITGGPGTGKTTVVNAIIKIYRSLHPDDTIQICAPTGRAAKRIGELTKQHADTIHRYLGWDLETNTFSHNEFDPLSGDFLIVDEFSMVDCQLLHHLLLATKSFKKILLIGDDQQLPPVSPGDVLRDLLELNKIATISLVNIHRQSADSGIIPLCSDIRQGILNENNLVNKSDVSFIECRNVEVKDYILNIAQKALAKGMSVQDIQVLAPMYAGVAGINRLNEALRELFNPHIDWHDEVLIGQTIYRVKDKILQLKNQPKDDVYNGDIGILEAIVRDEDDDKAFKLIVNFEGNMVTYTNANFANLTHAYCISVHKSQGSEYNLVIMPIINDYKIMLRKRLIYTGISRAKDSLILLGDINALRKGVHRVEQSKRKTSLQEKINYYLANSFSD